MANDVMGLTNQFLAAVAGGFDKIIIDVGDNAFFIGPADDAALWTNNVFTIKYQGDCT